MSQEMLNALELILMVEGTIDLENHTSDIEQMRTEIEIVFANINQDASRIRLFTPRQVLQFCLLVGKLNPEPIDPTKQ